MNRRQLEFLMDTEVVVPRSGYQYGRRYYQTTAGGYPRMFLGRPYPIRDCAKEAARAADRRPGPVKTYYATPEEIDAMLGAMP